MEIKRFEWDVGNINHIARHNVKPDEAEKVFWDDPSYRKARSGLMTALRRVENGRYLFRGICDKARRDNPCSYRREHERFRKTLLPTGKRESYDAEERAAGI